MNDYFVFSSIVLIGCLIAWAVMAATYGKQQSLCDAEVGQVFSFEYLQPLTGERKRHLAKVVEPVIRFSDTELNHMNARSSYRKHDPEFERTNHLVTCETADGEYRQFYCERAVNCRRPFFGLI